MFDPLHRVAEHAQLHPPVVAAAHHGDLPFTKALQDVMNKGAPDAEFERITKCVQSSHCAACVGCCTLLTRCARAHGMWLNQGNRRPVGVQPQPVQHRWLCRVFGKARSTGCAEVRGESQVSPNRGERRAIEPRRRVARECKRNRFGPVRQAEGCGFTASRRPPQAPEEKETKDSAAPRHIAPGFRA